MKKRYSLLAVFMSFVMSLLVVEPVWATTSTDLEEKQKETKHLLENETVKKGKLENIIKKRGFGHKGG